MSRPHTSLSWRKLGQIFDPAEHVLPNRCTEFAQSPQALVFRDFVRVYFSSRERESDTGKFLSHVCFADFSTDFQRLLRVSDRPVLPLGGPGCFDEHGIFPFSVTRHGDQISAYTTGWSRRVSVSVETSIGLATSADGGQTFERTGDGPVLTSSLREPFLVGDAFVRVFGGEYHMWYIFGTAWQKPTSDSPPERTYKIGHATSDDGVAWRKQEGVQIVEDRLNPFESQALPTVLRIGDLYHMVFCYRESTDFRSNPDRGYRLGHAWSADLAHWNRDDSGLGMRLSKYGWDSEMMCYPHLFDCDGRVYLLYNGNAFGRRGFGIAVLE